MILMTPELWEFAELNGLEALWAWKLTTPKTICSLVLILHSFEVLISNVHVLQTPTTEINMRQIKRGAF